MKLLCDMTACYKDEYGGGKRIEEKIRYYFTSCIVKMNVEELYRELRKLCKSVSFYETMRDESDCSEDYTKYEEHFIKSDKELKGYIESILREYTTPSVNTNSIREKLKWLAFREVEIDQIVGVVGECNATPVKHITVKKPRDIWPSIYNNTYERYFIIDDCISEIKQSILYDSTNHHVEAKWLKISVDILEQLKKPLSSDKKE